MSISKNYLLEQIKRLNAIDKDENRLYNRSDTEDDKYWLNHNRGHKDLLYLFKDTFLDNDENYVKKDLKEWLKKKHNSLKDKMFEMDKKYNYFQHDEELKGDDKFRYPYYDGIDCMIYILRQIINNEKYYNKKSYELSEWIIEEINSRNNERN